MEPDFFCLQLSPLPLQASAPRPLLTARFGSLSLMLVFPPSSLPFLSLLHKLVFCVHECLVVEASYSPPPPMSSSRLPTHMLATPTLWLSSQGLPLDCRPTHPAALDASHGHHKPLAHNMSKVGLIIFLNPGRHLLPRIPLTPCTGLQTSCALSSGNLCQRPLGVLSGPASTLNLRLKCKNPCF